MRLMTTKRTRLPIYGLGRCTWVPQYPLICSYFLFMAARVSNLRPLACDSVRAQPNVGLVVGSPIAWRARTGARKVSVTEVWCGFGCSIRYPFGTYWRGSTQWVKTDNR